VSRAHGLPSAHSRPAAGWGRGGCLGRAGLQVSSSCYTYTTAAWVLLMETTNMQAMVSENVQKSSRFFIKIQFCHLNFFIIS
jgi:hypothetical protein